MARSTWIDCLKPALYRYDPVSRRNRRVPADLPELVFGLALRRAGGLVLVASDGVSFLDPETGARTAVGDPEAGRPETVANDGACDRAGRSGSARAPTTKPTPSAASTGSTRITHSQAGRGLRGRQRPGLQRRRQRPVFRRFGRLGHLCLRPRSGIGRLSNRRAFATVPRTWAFPTA